MARYSVSSNTIIEWEHILKFWFKCVVIALLWGTFGYGAQPPARALSDAEQVWFKNALKAIKAGQWKTTGRFAKRVKTPLARKYLAWAVLTQTNPISSFELINHFLQQNPEWPQRRQLLRRAEQLIRLDLSPTEIVTWFGDRSPVSATGRGRLAGAFLALGQQEKAVKIIRKAWIDDNFPRAEEKAFYKNFRKHLTRADHIKRLDRLLWDGKKSAARRMFPKVNKAWVALAQARIHLRARSGNVDRLISKVPDSLKTHAGLAYERLRWRRRKGKDNVFEILENLPDDLIRPDVWWPDRVKLARRALSKGLVSIAYQAVTNHGLTGGGDYADAEWTAGWIALRFLDEHETAFSHFENMFKAVNFPVSLARGAYWAGRAKEAMNDQQAALTWYKRAAAYPTAYYGQLAFAKLKPGDSLPIVDGPNIHRTDDEAFRSHELVHVVELLNSVGQSELIRPFIHHLYDLNKDPAWRLRTARLARKNKRPDLAVWVAKRSSRDGVELPTASYPIISPPSLPRNLGVNRPEEPFVLALIRQESQFRIDAQSPVGARGLMQLMPRTARSVANSAKLRYSGPRLTSDPNYNMTLGQVYLAQLLERQNNSYVLALASYNAGPARAKRWVNDFGDLRDSDVDAIDWIEMIPFDETRNYVQRVLENLQVYRTRLAETEVALTLESDLHN